MNEREKTTDNDLARYLFHQGTNSTAYDHLGVHLVRTDNRYLYTFRVWAPNADAVDLIGDFSGWNDGYAMERLAESGIWIYTVSSETSLEGTFYKYGIWKNGQRKLKSDPYAQQSQSLHNTASVIYTEQNYIWQDHIWMDRRREMRKQEKRRKHFYPFPLNIYEIHPGSWRTRDGASTVRGENYLSYCEMADQLVVYIKEMGYTHVELMPVMEHPYDGSWGYQICGYYAPSGRFGAPDDFRYLVDVLHQNEIGVILDWVPAHFPKDEHGLVEFDGSFLYEYQGADRQEHKEWGTRYFDVGRNEVQSFLISNALFWMRRFHVDGLRVDAVASMLYLDYDRQPGEWFPNEDGGNRNREAISFFQKLNRTVKNEFPDVLMIAEESGDWPMITASVDEGGLGFDFKWNMGWFHDLSEYLSCDPLFRGGCHNRLTFPLMYAFGEQYILPVSHDEVVHGKKSLIEKVHGTYEEKFAMLRAFFLYMMTSPGKKLMFMGSEFAQFREWDYRNSLEWFLLAYPQHREMQKYMAALNHFYKASSELWEVDDGWDGFSWIDADLASEGILSYRRFNAHRQELIVVLNFMPVRRDEYSIPVQGGRFYTEVFTTESATSLGAKDQEASGYFLPECAMGNTQKSEYVLHISLPPYGGRVFRKMSAGFRRKQKK